MPVNNMTSEEWHLTNVSVDTKIKIKSFALKNGPLDLGPALAAIMDRLEELEKKCNAYENTDQ